MKTAYSPPFRITSDIVRLVSEISEILGRFSLTHSPEFSPVLRRSNRLKSVQASLAIENNTLSLEQVTAIINGKRILGHPREIREVKNAFAVYDMIGQLNPHSEKDLLKAHAVLMSSLVDTAGRYRLGGVGIMKGKTVVHVAPPAKRVPGLMRDLFTWLKSAEAHPLILSSIFHYEFEFIHPFADGNGRMGRLWQTVILSRWKPLLAYLPVETVVRNQQQKYYAALSTSDKEADATAFISFMLQAIIKALREAMTDPDSDQVSDQVVALLKLFDLKPLSATELMGQLGLSHKPTFRNNYLHPALDRRFIEMTIPDKPNSRLQKYRITPKGKVFIKGNK
jgi:Fic family protein